jgi:hypothetical protein
MFQNPNKEEILNQELGLKDKLVQEVYHLSHEPEETSVKSHKTNLKQLKTIIITITIKGINRQTTMEVMAMEMETQEEVKMLTR